MKDESKILQLIEQAESCLDKGELVEARQLYASICRVKDDDSHAWLMLGTINSELGNIEVAQSALERAVAVDAENAEAHLALAHILKVKGRTADALASASLAIAANTNYVNGWLFVAATAGQLGNWPRAEEACNKVIALTPERVEAHVNLGNVLLGTGRFLQAEERFRKALTLGDVAEAWFGIGMALGALDRHAEAEPALAKASQTASKSVVFREAWANCLDRLGRADESAAVLAGSGRP